MMDTLEMKVPSYTSPKALGHRMAAGIETAARVVQEKVDGSQVGFMLTAEGELLFRSRGGQFTAETVQDQFRKAFEHINSVKDRLTPNVVYRGEAVKGPKHNLLKYERGANGGLVLFDIEHYLNGGLGYYPQPRVQEAAALLEIDYAPVYRELKPFEEYTKEMFEKDMLRTSVLGGNIEGVVIKAYSMQNADGKLLAAKYVSDEFKERATPKPRSTKIRENPVHKIIQELKVEARYRKAVQHLSEEGKLTGTPKDIGPLMKELHLDMEKEHTEYIKETLYKSFINEIKKEANKDFPAWYKKELGIIG